MAKQTNVRVEYKTIYHHIKFESNPFLNVWMPMLPIFMPSLKQQLFPLFKNKISL